MNKGEWSEVYAFLKLLADGQVYGADDSLNKVDEWLYPVLEIIRDSKRTSLTPLQYQINHQAGVVKVISHSKVIGEIGTSALAEKAKVTLEEILKSEGSFEMPELISFFDEIGSPKLKENSQSKRDITAVVRDNKVGRDHTVGFSIKSKLGADSTLFNAGTATNFRFRVNGYKDLTFAQQSSMEGQKAKSLVKSLLDIGCSFSFKEVVDPTFRKNLRFIDSKLDKLFAAILEGYYSGKATQIHELSQLVEQLDPCQYYEEFEDTPQRYYVHKVKQFLLASALGMTAKKPWDGTYDASGGYIIVKSNGELVCYHIYNWNLFQDYLFNNTYLDTASTSRHGFGTLEVVDGEAFINFNLQIRFKA